jgi:hypothetical protein
VIRRDREVIQGSTPSADLYGINVTGHQRELEMPIVSIIAWLLSVPVMVLALLLTRELAHEVFTQQPPQRHDGGAAGRP